MILDRLRRNKKKPEPDIARSEFLQIIPVKNPNIRWEKDKDGKTTIIISAQKTEDQQKDIEFRGKKRKRRSIFSNYSPTPREKKIQLDTIGSIVWEMCDGKKTIEAIMGELYEKYKLLTSEAEISLKAYFNQLSKRGLVGFVLPEDLAKRIQTKREKNE